ncbi:MAG: hypothetical protein A4E58_01402 [Syntrophorhabdus sp. PtaB.Bin006]|nr:MAG: hypothetical protein A4E58_01402 [Syntrophorhabdus sp. PtaB.Bin006]
MALLRRKKLHKEVGMKKFIVIALALFLAVPAISFAGSATSRWDVTIGGYVKFDMGYMDQSHQGADYWSASRHSDTSENINDEYGNLFSAGGETRLNFLVQGPDGWGAKTSAFVEGDFSGRTSGDGYGAFSLRHAFMKMQWANDSLTIGHTWQRFGLMPSFANILLAWNMLGAFQKGTRQPQIMWEHNFNKNIGFALGIISPTDSLGVSATGAGTGAQKVDGWSRSPYPFGEGELYYTSDACGKIGPWQMLFSISGFYGQWKGIANAAGTDVTTSTTAVSSRFDDDDTDAWGLAFKAFIPIIPEKKGNKAGALSLSGQAFATQNPSWYLGPFALGSYQRADGSLATPLLVGGWGQITYFFTDKLFISGWYGNMQYKLSERYRAQNAAVAYAAGRDQVKSEQQYIVNLSYDVNPAMRLGIEYDRINTKYAASVAGLERDGSMNAFRIGAWYFF